LVALKTIVKKPIRYALDLSVDFLLLTIKLTDRLFHDEPEVSNAPADSFEALRNHEKDRFEAILNREMRQIKPEHVENRLCPNCNSDSYQLFFTTQDLFDYVKCQKCGFVYALQMLKHETRTDLYGGLTGTEAADFCCSPEGVEADFQRFEFPLKLIRKYKRSGDLLDVGCGVGNFLNQARTAGFSVRGIETHEEFRKAAKANYDIDVATGIFEQMDLPEDHFQVVTMWETLEHIYDPKAAVRKAFKILAPMGILAISVPNLANFGFFLLREYSGHRGGEHINFFSPATLSRMLTDNGFTIVEVHTTENSDWRAVMNLLNLNIGTLYCYSNIGKKNEDTPTVPFIHKHELSFLNRIVFPLLSRYERRTGRGSGITILAQKKDERQTVLQSD
jgi:SAM-dependent methyltransferase